MAKIGTLLLFIWLLLPPPSFAALVHIDDHTPTPLNLIPWLVVTHPSASSQLADIQSLPKEEWHNFTHDDIQKLSLHNFWLSFSLHNDDDTLSRILALNNPLLDNVTIYHLVDDKLINTEYMGDTFPHSNRPLLNNNFLYPFKITPHEQHTFYLHIETEGSAAVSLNLWSTNDLAQITESVAVEHGFQLGVLGAIGIVSLFIALTSGSFSYRYYSGYVLSITLLVATINGFAFRFLWPNWPALQQLMVPILLPLVMAFAAMFTEKILQLKHHNRRMLLICRYSAVFILLVSLLVPFVRYGTVLYLEIISVAILCVILMMLAIVQAINGHKLARLYTIGRVSMLVGAFVSSLLYLGVINLDVKPHTPVMLGLTFEIIFMSLVLAIRYDDERKARLAIQQEALQQAQKIHSAREEALKLEEETSKRLEQMVQERTLELEITLRELHDVNQKLTEQSTIDSLTGVKNRNAFNKRLLVESKISCRQQTPIALLMVDIDKFKSINDHFGHLAGDQALKVIAKTLQQHLKRPTDLVSRFGGEEFAIILPNTMAEGALKVAEGIRAAVTSIDLKWEGMPIPLTISIGVSADIVASGQHSTELLEQADKALYQAKNNGRNQVTLYVPARAEPN